MLTVLALTWGRLSPSVRRIFETVPESVATGSSRLSTVFTAGHSACVFSMYSIGVARPKPFRVKMSP